MFYNYKIHVLNRDINFDISNKNVVQFFNPLNNTKDYTGVFTSEELTFNEYYDETETDIINFDAGDGVNASVVLDLNGENVANQFLTNENALTIQQALSRQYCIIDEIIFNDEGIKQSSKLYFYFIVGYSLKNANTIKYNLKIDAFTTYPLFSDIAVDETKILRAHTDRYTIDSTPANAKYNLNSRYLQTAEPLDNIFTKIRKEKINKNFVNFAGILYKDLGNTPIAKSTIENILNKTKWLYIMYRQEASGGGINANVILTAPYITKNPSLYNVKYYISPNDNYTQDGHEINANVAYGSLSENPHIYNAFISPLAPFGTLKTQESNYYIAYKLTGYNLDIIFVNNNILQNNQDLNGDNVKTKGAIYDALNYDYATIVISYSDTRSIGNFISYFETDEIILFNDSPTPSNYFDYTTLNELEPKTKIRQNFNDYVLKSTFDNGDLILDLSIIKTNKIKIKAIQNISGITNGEIYATINDLNILDYGLFTKTQYTPLFYNDKFEQYKATNTNYAITGQAIPILSGTLAGGIAGAKIGGVYGAVAGAVVGFGASAYKVYTNFDNMQNSPDAIKLKGQNITIDEAVQDNFIYLEHNQIREKDNRELTYYFFEYGYNISEINDIKNFFTRSSFNYIQLEDCEKNIHALINKNVLDIIIKSLNEGVRFWTKEHYNHSKFNYTTSNIENRLK